MSFFYSYRLLNNGGHTSNLRIPFVDINKFIRLINNFLLKHDKNCQVTTEIQ